MSVTAAWLALVTGPFTALYSAPSPQKALPRAEATVQQQPASDPASSSAEADPPSADSPPPTLAPPAEPRSAITPQDPAEAEHPAPRQRQTAQEAPPGGSPTAAPDPATGALPVERAPRVPAPRIDPETRTIVVTGTRTRRQQRDAPVVTDVVDRETIEQTGAENALEVLEETAGVQVDRGIGGAGLVLQGLDPKYTLILVDGQRVGGRVGGTIDLTRFPAETIERIEIVRGPSSVLYGADALAGTINIITRAPTRRWEAEAHSAYGSFGTLDLSGRVGHRGEHYAGSVTAGVHNTDGWDADPSDLTTTGPRGRSFDVATTQRWLSEGMFELDSAAQYLRRTQRSVNALDTGAVFDRVNRSETLTARLSPSLTWDDGSLQVSGSYSLFRDQFVNDQRNSTALDDSQDTFDHIAQVSAVYSQRLGKHEMTAGMDGQAEVLLADRIDPPQVDRQRYALFVQDEWKPLGDAVSVLPGMRVDYDSFFGIYGTPRLALMFRPNDRWRLRASYGRGYRAPSFREMYLLFTNAGVGYQVNGNPSLRPETSWSTNVSAQFFPWRWASLQAAAFDHRLSDTIVIDTLDDDTGGLTLFGYDNIGSAQTRGLETTASFTQGPLTLDGSYTLTHTEDVDTGRSLPGRARHRGTAGVRFWRRQWGTTLRIRSSIVGRREFFVDRNDDDVLEALRPSPYATLDARISQSFTRHAEAFIGADNLLNAGNATDNPLVPRSYYGGITLRY